LPDILPDKHVSVRVVERLILCIGRGHGPDGEVRQARGVGVVIDRVPKVLIAREVRWLLKLMADEVLVGTSPSGGMELWLNVSWMIQSASVAYCASGSGQS
jgi:hypothetical protein